MPRKSIKIPGYEIGFPFEQLWENERDSWERDLGADPLGDDLDGRLFAVQSAIKTGTAPAYASETLIQRADIEALLQPLQLPELEPVSVRLWQIAGRHLRPKHMEILGSGPTDTVTLLQEVTGGIVQLEDALERIPIVVRDFLTAAFPLVPRSYRNNEKLDIVALERALPDLAHLTFLVSDALTRKRRRPPNVLRKQTLRDATVSLELATGQTIKTQWTEDGQPCFKFKGEPGRALFGFMKLVEPRVSERALVTDLRAMLRNEQAASGSSR